MADIPGPSDRLQNNAARAGGVIADEMRQRLAELMLENQHLDLVDLAGELLAEFGDMTDSTRNLLREVIEEAIKAGFVQGGAAAIKQVGKFLPPKGPTPPLPSPPNYGGEPKVVLVGLERAKDNLLGREVLQPADYYAMDAEAKAQAFTITTDIIDASTDKFRADVLEILQEQIKSKVGFDSFKDSVLDAYDTLPISKGHLHHVFRNNLNESFAQGQEAVLDHPLVADEFPYRQYDSIHDGAVRDEHEAMESLGLNGTNIYHKDDPTWIRFRPPWSWNCRCAWTPISIEDAARKGVKEAQEWLKTGIEPTHTPVSSPSFRPDPRWERMPELVA